MSSCRTIALLGFAMTAISAPAYACMTDAPLVLEDVRHASAVVVGRITRYEIILDPEMMERRHQVLAGLPAAEREAMARRSMFLSDYARFEIAVDDVLLGSVSPRLVVTWNNSTFGEPDALPTGLVMVALQNPRAPMPPLRGPSATTMANPEPALLTVLQAPCSEAFIFEDGSREASRIRAILRPVTPPAPADSR